MKTKQREPSEPSKMGRPRTLKNPSGMSCKLDGIHRRVLARHMREHNLPGMSATVRDVIERYFEVRP